MKSTLMGRTASIACAAAAVAMAFPAYGQILINGAGATFPAPIYTKWFSEYRSVDSSANINYQAVGSGAGINQVTNGIVDFGASDAPMTDEQEGKAKIKLLHFPTVMGAVVVTYNIPGVTTSLNLTGDVIAGIFLGKITMWNDPQITKLNHGVNLPADKITTAHRADASGTTYAFTDYLSSASAEWKNGPGKGASVNWPGGLASKGSDGVTGLVKQQKNSIGYVELIYAVHNKLQVAKVKNKDGEFVEASLAGVTLAAAAAAKQMPADFRASIVNEPGKGVYPISTFTWLLVPEQISDPGKKKVIVGFLKWMLDNGQTYCEGLDYAQLPKSVVAQELKAIDKIK